MLPCVALLRSPAISCSEFQAGCSQPDECVNYLPGRSLAMHFVAGQGWSVLGACHRFMLEQMASAGVPLIAPVMQCKLRCPNSDHSKLQVWLCAFVDIVSGSLASASTSYRMPTSRLPTTRRHQVQCRGPVTNVRLRRFTCYSTVQIQRRSARRTVLAVVLVDAYSCPSACG